MDFSEKHNYKPDFKLEYTDEDGKPISAKEAFRILSHKFHGKGSGKNKVDKKRRKIEQEKVTYPAYHLIKLKVITFSLVSSSKELM